MLCSFILHHIYTLETPYLRLEVNEKDRLLPYNREAYDFSRNCYLVCTNVDKYICKSFDKAHLCLLRIHSFHSQYSQKASLRNNSRDKVIINRSIIPRLRNWSSGCFLERKRRGADEHLSCPPTDDRRMCA